MHASALARCQNRCLVRKHKTRLVWGSEAVAGECALGDALAGQQFRCATKGKKDLRALAECGSLLYARNSWRVTSPAPVIVASRVVTAYFMSITIRISVEKSHGNILFYMQENKVTIPMQMFYQEPQILQIKMQTTEEVLSPSSSNTKLPS